MGRNHARTARTARKPPSAQRRRPDPAGPPELSRRYLDDRAEPSSVRWVDNQQQRWGSCTIDDGSIRLSHRLQGMPAWVIDYVLLHELAHLLVPGHGPEFWALAGAATRAPSGPAVTSRASPRQPGCHGPTTPEPSPARRPRRGRARCRRSAPAGRQRAEPSQRHRLGADPFAGRRPGPARGTGRRGGAPDVAGRRAPGAGRGAAVPGRRPARRCRSPRWPRGGRRRASARVAGLAVAARLQPATERRCSAAGLVAVGVDHQRAGGQVVGVSSCATCRRGGRPGVRGRPARSRCWPASRCRPAAEHANRVGVQPLRSLPLSSSSSSNRAARRPCRRAGLRVRTGSARLEAERVVEVGRGRAPGRGAPTRRRGPRQALAVAQRAPQRGRVAQTARAAARDPTSDANVCSAGPPAARRRRTASRSAGALGIRSAVAWPTTSSTQPSTRARTVSSRVERRLLLGRAARLEHAARQRLLHGLRVATGRGRARPPRWRTGRCGCHGRMPRPRRADADPATVRARTAAGGRTRAARCRAGRRRRAGRGPRRTRRCWLAATRPCRPVPAAGRRRCPRAPRSPALRGPGRAAGRTWRCPPGRAGPPAGPAMVRISSGMAWPTAVDDVLGDRLHDACPHRPGVLDPLRPAPRLRQGGAAGEVGDAVEPQVGQPDGVGHGRLLGRARRRVCLLRHHVTCDLGGQLPVDRPLVRREPLLHLPQQR